MLKGVAWGCKRWWHLCGRLTDGPTTYLTTQTWSEDAGKEKVRLMLKGVAWGCKRCYTGRRRRLCHLRNERSQHQ